jgi:hypothetical protein
MSLRKPDLDPSTSASAADQRAVKKAAPHGFAPDIRSRTGSSHHARHVDLFASAANAMVELHQMANGIGPGAWSAVASFHQIATS